MCAGAGGAGRGEVEGFGRCVELGQGVGLDTSPGGRHVPAGTGLDDVLGGFGGVVALKGGTALVFGC